MEYNTMWQLFNDTGDPLGYLMYKAALRKREGVAAALSFNSAAGDEGSHPRSEQAQASSLRSE